MGQMSRQRIRYVRSPDGTRLAWADAGSGPVIVKASNWLTHLEYDFESPVWRHWLEFFTDNFRLIRYDERGCGMSDRDVEMSFSRWLADFEAVIDAADLQEPFTLLGVSQGALFCTAFVRSACASLVGTTDPSDFRCASIDLAFGLYDATCRDDGCADGSLVFRASP